MKVWFVTGASKGFGKVWARAALGRGDRVAATARRLEDLDDLRSEFGESVLPLRLDVTDREADFAAVGQAHEKFGRLDVVVNNAGYAQTGAVEELNEAELRGQLETNLFGALWVTQAALPLLRARGSGHIIQVSSIGGVVAFPNVGAYHASKWALEGITQSLAQEVEPFGVRVTLVEPGDYATEASGASARQAAPNPAYDGLRTGMAALRDRLTTGDPEATGPAMLRLADMDEPPLRVFFGAAPLGIVEREYAARLKTWRAHDDLSREANG